MKKGRIVLHVGWALLLAAAACSDPSRDDCKISCTDVFGCRDKINVNLTEDYLDACQGTCDEAVKVDDIVIKCIVAAEQNCDVIKSCLEQDQAAAGTGTDGGTDATGAAAP